MNKTNWLNKIRLNLYILSKKRLNKLPLFGKIAWHDNYFSYSFEAVELIEILKLEGQCMKKRYQEVPYILQSNLPSKECDDFTNGIIKVDKLHNYLEEVRVKDILGEYNGQGETIEYNSIEQFMSKNNKKTNTFNNYASYYYLFNMNAKQFRDLFINKEIYESQMYDRKIGMNTVYLLEKNKKYYVIINGTHRVLFAKLIGIETIKAVVFKAN
ncbi:hypothetical protein ACN9UU_08370 [Staphylococcus caprae]|uniref:hypothetical protein n=1 Tax=Staphylococcus caprae TaxID=29380 RepID=UPI0005C7F987|nr:hypothetical protein [Staphylococcus caprae]MBU5272850.1 hypothetical protein [Staphylococcus caprae]QJE24318.1 hypothetical protein HHJ99_00635 [Staphylococcus caprae]